ncbi:hypothetical protein T4E_9332 [Trichinella pseudospiralis]|uniref:Uncharacterized protein n=1 Tax=Trichinella pseudospiralis TaxID=6337 RepID=A0A0V0XVC1_TRIPS|nr:hypothetical protein T4E_9332 [Trichinella pseudospiralis]
MLHNLLLFQNSSLVHFRLEKLLLFFKKTNKQENKNTAQVLNADYTEQSRPLYGTCVNARGDCYTLRRPARRRLGYIGAREKEQKKRRSRRFRRGRRISGVHKDLQRDRAAQRSPHDDDITNEKRTTTIPTNRLVIE